MKSKISSLSDEYLAALRLYLEQGSRASLQSALGLGRRAVVLKLETLALARIHEHSIAELGLSGKKNGPIKRAEKFFAEAITPISENSLRVHPGKNDFNPSAEALIRRTRELSATNRRLKRSITRRQGAQTVFDNNRKRYSKLLKSSAELQDELRSLTHRMLADQEDERHKLSHDLQDEIAQTLLGINIRLLSLKNLKQGPAKELKDEIASLELLVIKSSGSVRKFASDLDIPHALRLHQSVTRARGRAAAENSMPGMLPSKP